MHISVTILTILRHICKRELLKIYRFI